MNGNRPNRLWRLLEGHYVQNQVYNLDQLNNVYHLVELLGAGGYGAAYRAHQLDGDRVSQVVALKLMELVDIDRQSQELQNSLRTNHPNLIRYFDVGTAEIDQVQFLFLAMELAECSLQDYLHQLNRPLTPTETRVLVADVAAGLLSLHSPPQQIVHRDINPGNILRVGGHWKIGDFGLTRILGDRSQGGTSNPRGREGFAPPEAYAGRFNPASDLWSLGIIIVFALTREIPFTFSTPEELIYCVVNCNLSIPRLPSPFREIVQGCLQRNPKNRWTAQRVLDTLNPPVPYHQPVTPPAPQPVTPPAPPQPQPSVQHQPVTPPSPPQPQPPVQRQPAGVSRRWLLMGLGGVLGALGWEQMRRLPDLTRPGKPISSPTPLPPSPSPSTPSPSPSPKSDAPSPSPSPQPDTPSPSVTGNQPLVEDLGGGVALHMQYIPRGSFWMGSTPEQIAAARADGLRYGVKEEDIDRWLSWETPNHQVKVPAFYMGKYEVTNAEWKAVMNTNPSGQYDAKFQDDRQPVVGVSWEDAQAFCQKLSQRSGRLYRLPTEAEWEYACRAGTTTPFYFGETITTDQVNYDGNYPYGNGKKGIYRERTTNVGSFPANGFGLFDMHGNVWEWCADDWHDSYADKPEKLKQDGSLVWTAKKSEYKLLRGGSWDGNAWGCRSALRLRTQPGGRDNVFGFRVCCSPQ